MKIQMDLSEELDGMVLIKTLISLLQPNTGVIIAGDRYEETTIQPILRIYLIAIEEEGWIIETELQALAFSDIDRGNNFFPTYQICPLSILWNTLDGKVSFDKVTAGRFCAIL